MLLLQAGCLGSRDVTTAVERKVEGECCAQIL
jgi:hypothetical protein